MPLSVQYNCTVFASAETSALATFCLLEPMYRHTRGATIVASSAMMVTTTMISSSVNARRARRMWATPNRV